MKFINIIILMFSSAYSSNIIIDKNYSSIFSNSSYEYKLSYKNNDKNIPVLPSKKQFDLSSRLQETRTLTAYYNTSLNK
jgi:hypothetical protein